jgi:GDP-L-fucose synthase
MPTNIYGYGDHFDPETSHVIPALMGRMHTAKLENASEFVVWGDGTARREFLYVDDLAEAIIFLMEQYNEKLFINVGTGEDMSIREVAEEIKKVVGYQGKLVFDSSKPNGMPRKLLDVSKINRLGWKHSTSLFEGLRRTYEYYKDHVLKTS